LPRENEIAGEIDGNELVLTNWLGEKVRIKFKQ